MGLLSLLSVAILSVYIILPEKVCYFYLKSLAIFIRILYLPYSDANFKV